MEVPSMRQVSRTYWWLLLIRGIFAVLFGILAIIAPVVAALFFIFLFGAYVLLDGILSILVGIVFFVHPVGSIFAIVWLIGVFALVRGVILLFRAIRFRSLLTG